MKKTHDKKKLGKKQTDGLSIIGTVCALKRRRQHDGGQREMSSPVDLSRQSPRGLGAGLGRGAVEIELSAHVPKHHVAPRGGGQQRVFLTLVRSPGRGKGPRLLGRRKKVVRWRPVQRRHQEVKARRVRAAVLLQQRVQLGPSSDHHSTVKPWLPVGIHLFFNCLLINCGCHSLLLLFTVWLCAFFGDKNENNSVDR